MGTALEREYLQCHPGPAHHLQQLGQSWARITAGLAHGAADNGLVEDHPQVERRLVFQPALPRHPEVHLALHLLAGLPRAKLVQDRARVFLRLE